jgi:hypothetical protein
MTSTAAWLGWLGLLPFLLGTLLVLHPEWREAGLLAFRSYGAVILSFLGGVRWGAALAESRGQGAALSVAVLPALVGWTALLAPPASGMSLLAAGFLAQAALDARFPPPGVWPAAYRRLRLRLSAAVLALHAGVLMVLATGAWA